MALQQHECDHIHVRVAPRTGKAQPFILACRNVKSGPVVPDFANLHLPQRGKFNVNLLYSSKAIQ